MRHKKNGISIVLLLLLLISIVYAALNSELKINGVANLTGNTWDIHFDNVNVIDGSVIATTEAEIDQEDNTKISYEIELSKPGDYYEFTVDVVNAGSLPGKVAVSSLSGIDSSLEGIVEYSVTYINGDEVAVDDLLNPNYTKTIRVRVYYNEDIDNEDLISSDVTMSLTYDLTYVQGDSIEVFTTIDTYDNKLSSTYLSDTYKTKIKTITLEKSINIPNDAVVTWDIGVVPDKVKAFLLTNQDDNTMYDLYIQGDGSIVANEDSSYLFYNLSHVDSITGLENLDTSNVTNMSFMFSGTGFSSTVFTLDLGDNFDTSNVTDMSYMFCDTGSYSPAFTLDLGDNFDTSNVTDMSYMFNETGSSSTVFTLDLGDKFHTSNVTNIYHMFDYTGYSSTVFTLDLGDNFDTSNVTDMSYMFNGTGYSNDYFELDISTFDFNNVNSYDYIFSSFSSTQKIWVKDVNAQNWILSHANNPDLTTSNVLIKS